MNRNASIALTVAAAMVAIVTVASLTSAQCEDPRDAETSDLIGHWYIIDSYGDTDWLIGDDGKLRQSSSMDVFDVPDGRGFYGKYMGHPMAGQMSSQGRMEATVSAGDMITHINGRISDNGIVHIIGTYSVAGQDGDVSDVGTYVLQLSKIWNDVPENEDTIDIHGDWKISHALCPGGDEAYLPDHNVNVTQERNRCAVSIRDGLRLTIELHMTMYVVGDVLSGIGISPEGNFWILIFDGDTLSLDLNLCNDIDNVPDVCQITLSRDGHSVTAEPLDLGLLGTGWRSVNTTTYYPDGNVTVNRSSSYMSFMEQNGDMYTLDWNRIGNRDVTINFTDHGTVALQVWSIDNASIVAFHGMFDRETETFDLTMVSWLDGMLCLTEITLEERRIIDDSDITGHWYMVRSIGYDSHGDFITLSPGEGDIMYDLDIYGVSNGLIYGRFGGSAMTGSYLDGILTIFSNGNFGMCAMEGRVVDEKTMVFTETYFDDSMKKSSNIESWMTVMSRDLGGGAPEPVTADILGKWKLSYGKHFDGTSVELEESVLNIISFHDNVLYGTVTGKNVSSIVKGSMLPYGDGDSATGILVHEDGSIWSVIVRDGRIIAKTAVSDDSPAMEAWAVQAVFTRSGEPVTDDISYPRMIGTWRSDIITTMDGRGHLERGTFPYTFKITGQDGFGLVGTATQPGIEGAMAMAVTMNPNGQFTFHIASDFSINNDLDIGYGWLDDEGNMYIVETYVNAAGIQTTQLTRMALTLG